MIIEKKSDCSIKISAPAKINLFLEVLGKRDDGYHNINSLFQAVSLYDYLTFTKMERGSFELTISEQPNLKPDQSNLVAKTFAMMQSRYDIKGTLHVHLEKHIPLAAGLAGGSTDAVSTIMAVNMLWELGLSKTDLVSISLEIGSDLPFFFSSGQAKVTGRGEIVEDTDFPTDYIILLVSPDLQVSTAEAYSSLKMALTKQAPPFTLPRCGTVDDLVVQLCLSRNDFEEVHLRSYPVLGKIKEGLLKYGARMVRMSGSGPTMFGIYESAPSENVIAFLDNQRCRHYLVKPITLPHRD